MRQSDAMARSEVLVIQEEEEKGFRIERVSNVACSKVGKSGNENGAEMSRENGMARNAEQRCC